MMSSPRANRHISIWLSALTGAVVLAGLSYFQKLAAGIPTSMPQTYVLPFLVGGLCGGLGGWFIRRLETVNAKLAANESRIRMLIENIDAGVLILNPETRRIENASRHVLDLLGMEIDEVVGHRIDIFLRVDTESDGGEDGLCMAKAEGVLHTKDGSHVPVLRSAKCIELEGEPRALVTVTSISRQKRAESLLAGEAQRRKALLEKSNDGIAIIDQEHRVIEANERFAAMLGYNQDEVLGLYTWEYVADLSMEAIRKGFSDLHSISRVFESVHRRKDGSTYPAEVSASGLLVNGESLVLVICRDISGRKRDEAILLEAKRAAEAASRVKSEFLANMSHEIRTPINGMMGMLQLVSETEVTREQAEFLGYARRAGARLTRLLSDILDLTRVESGRMEITSVPFDLAEIIESTRQLYMPEARKKGIGMGVDVVPETPLHLLGDAVRVQQILGNLVGNAIKFTDKGNVGVEVCPLPNQPDGRARILFIVSDTGPGLTDEQLGMIFSPFTQVDGSYRRRFQGAGLGLSICARLVDLMQGSMAVESEVGSGSRFYLSLPFKLADAPILSTDQGQEAVAVQGLDILLAEDDRTSRLFATRTLEKAGHVVTPVENGLKALDALKEQSYDLVLLDIEMPVLDGITAVAAIRQGKTGEGNKDVPVIALTAHTMDGDRERFLEAGMNGYVSKPLEPESLQAAIAAVLG